MDVTQLEKLTEEQRYTIRRYCGYPRTSTETMEYNNGMLLLADACLDSCIQAMSGDAIIVTLSHVAMLHSIETATEVEADDPIMETIAVWKTMMPPELEASKSKAELMFEWQNRFCDFLNIPAGPLIVSPSRS